MERLSGSREAGGAAEARARAVAQAQRERTETDVHAGARTHLPTHEHAETLAQAEREHRADQAVASCRLHCSCWTKRFNHLNSKRGRHFRNCTMGGLVLTLIAALQVKKKYFFCNVHMHVVLALDAVMAGRRCFRSIYLCVLIGFRQHCVG